MDPELARRAATRLEWAASDAGVASRAAQDAADALTAAVAGMDWRSAAGDAFRAKAAVFAAEAQDIADLAGADAEALAARAAELAAS